MEHEFERRFPTNGKDYKLYEEVGEGVSATVYRALCIPLNQIVAIKVLDLERCNNDLDGIRREVQLMTLIDHPNVLRAHCSFTVDQSLWIVMPYMAGGSGLHIIKSSYPDGFEEPVIATLLREVLKALVYLHGQGHIHRDVKAGNILIDGNGTVKLGDFGVSACMFDAGDRQRSRNTFVGTPCWMAPEVMQQLHGYDFKADIWSFGITALELAHGHAPFSKYPPMKVLLMTLQNAPPGLDYERDKRFSKSFKDMVSTCLVKDPKKRPSSEKLLKHSFFKRARSNEYLAHTILDGLPPLGDRFRTLKGKEANFLLGNKTMSGDKEQLSQKEYIRGISGWNFNLENLKAQAALIQYPEDDNFNSGDPVNNCILKDGGDDAYTAPQSPSDNSHKLKDFCNDIDTAPHALFSERVDHVSTATPTEDGRQDLQDLEGPFAPVFPSLHLQALKTCFDVSKVDIIGSSPDAKDLKNSNPEYVYPMQQLSNEEGLESRKDNSENMGRSSSVPKNIYVLGCRKFSSGSLLPEQVLSPYKHIDGDIERDDIQKKNQYGRNNSGTLLYRQKKDLHSPTPAKNILAKETMQEESSEGGAVQHKGRFRITSIDAGTKVASSTNSTVNKIGVPTNPTENSVSVLPSLHFLLQQNAMQKEQLIKLIEYAEQTSGFPERLSNISTNELQPTQASIKETELQIYVAQLQQSIRKLTEEVQRLKFQNTQLEQQIGALINPKEKRAQC